MNPSAPRVLSIVPYQASWPDEFLELGQAIRSVLGSMALRIDHIGSTAVPGLDAKDIIDIQVSVAELDAPAIADPLAALGYTLRTDITGDHVPAGANPDPELWRKVYFRAPERQRPTHLHVRKDAAPNQQYPLLFRDYLRAIPGAAATYGVIKRELLQQNGGDADAYYAIKDPVMDLIMDSAYAWAKNTGWELGPSDA